MEHANDNFLPRLVILITATVLLCRSVPPASASEVLVELDRAVQSGHAALRRCASQLQGVIECRRDASPENVRFSYRARFWVSGTKYRVDYVTKDGPAKSDRKLLWTDHDCVEYSKRGAVRSAASLTHYSVDSSNAVTVSIRPDLLNPIRQSFCLGLGDQPVAQVFELKGVRAEREVSSGLWRVTVHSDWQQLKMWFDPEKFYALRRMEQRRVDAGNVTNATIEVEMAEPKPRVFVVGKVTVRAEQRAENASADTPPLMSDYHVFTIEIESTDPPDPSVFESRALVPAGQKVIERSSKNGESPAEPTGQSGPPLPVLPSPFTPQPSSHGRSVLVIVSFAAILFCVMAFYFYRRHRRNRK